MSLVKRLRRLVAPPAPSRPQGPEGERAYAVGDIHGRLDLLDQLLETIVSDSAARPPRTDTVVFLGDLVDRGPDSAGVIDRLLQWRPSGIRPVFLAGNHEEMLLRVIDGDEAVVMRWLEFGGAECVSSYGLDPERLKCLSPRRACDRIAAAVPVEHREFLESFGDTFEFGGYLFVHAGIRPGVALRKQTPADLRWIRQPFLDDDTDHGVVVVHGHTIFDSVDERPNRIGIDTGAYRSGILTAVAIEDDRRWYLTAGEPRSADGRTAAAGLAPAGGTEAIR